MRSDEIAKVMTKRVKRKGELRKQGETTHTDEKTNDTWLQSMELGCCEGVDEDLEKEGNTTRAVGRNDSL